MSSCTLHCHSKSNAQLVFPSSLERSFVSLAFVLNEVVRTRWWSIHVYFGDKS